MGGSPQVKFGQLRFIRYAPAYIYEGDIGQVICGIRAPLLGPQMSRTSTRDDFVRVVSSSIRKTLFSIFYFLFLVIVREAKPK
jgi:hypothetical protein